LLRQAQPDRIFHLAGYAGSGQSFRDPDAAWRGNLEATRCLYDAIERWGGKPRILFVSSGLIYGDSEGANQLYDESNLLRPASPYGASKAAADLLSYQYSRHPGLDIVCVRPFNHIGPRQSPEFAVAHFAQQIAAIEKGRQSPVLETGNLDSRRDWTDVRDMVQAYLLLMEHGRQGEVYNASAGAVYSMRDILDRLLALSPAKIEIRTRRDLLRPADASGIRGDARKLRDTTGWRPRYNLEQTLTDTLEYWRRQA
jgi:GDP-4-dehydro-6-deoxy-D-mannose reductase